MTLNKEHRQVTIITGTTQGIGNSLADELAPRADKLIRINRRSTGQADEILCDLRSHEAVKQAAGELAVMVTKTDDVLFVLNAGYSGGEKKLSDITPEALGPQIYANAYGQLTLVESLVGAVRHLKLVAITSSMGSVSRPDASADYPYSGSKAVLNQGVRSMHEEHPNLDYLLAHPGWVQTQLGGEEAFLTPSESARQIVAVMDDPANWNRPDGMFKTSTGEIIPL